MEPKIRGHYPPAVITAFTGTYVVDGLNWLPVPAESSYEDAILAYEAEYPTKYPKLKEVPERQFEVKSATNPDVTYTVRLWKWGGWNCECLGFSYRRTCRHVDECKLLLASTN